MARTTAASRSKPPRSYDDKRDFSRTPEPRGGVSRGGAPKAGPIFVVQKHDASRLHWDFRLEHGGVLWSWAVPKGPSLDPKHKRLAMHVEDHPLDYAGFEGTIPAGNYGAGTVELWDQGHWRPLADDPAAALRAGELKFVLDGNRLHGGFVLVRLKQHLSKTGVPEKAESWLLIKEQDAAVAPGADAAALERQLPRKPVKVPAGNSAKRKPKDARDPLPETQAPQLATLVTEAPAGAGWISEIKFDGYRMLCRRDGDAVRLFTRNGLDWTDRVPALAAAVAALPASTLLLDGELVALDRDGRSSFGALQEVLRTGRTRSLVYYAFDLLHRDGSDLRSRKLSERKQALAALLKGSTGLEGTTGLIRLSEHLASEAAQVGREACKVGLEGIVCKRLDAPYKAGRGRDWLKLKCENREEAVIIGSTPPQGSRAHLGALLLARHDALGRLRFAGGVGTGFSGQTLRMLDERLRALATRTAPKQLQNRAAAPRDARWVKPELVAELRFAGITEDGMFRQASFLGLREDKPAGEVVADVVPEHPKPSRIVTATQPASRDVREVAGQRLTHPDRLLWPRQGSDPGVTKADLAAYWEAVAARALPEIADRPLALVRCPDGIAGEHFFQKHKTRGMPDALREGTQDDAPYLALSHVAGLVAAAQIAAIELHGWGSPGCDPAHADRLVFDLDPADDVPFARTVAAALEVRRRLEAAGLACYPRTSGGKGLHVVAPVSTRMDWDAVRAWTRRFAESMQRDAPELYVSSTRKTRRSGRILVDWLRNGLGSTAVASYSPRARPGATVATPLSWREVTPKLDIKAFTIRTVPDRVRRADPWRDFERDRRELRPAKE
ncbi:DNA ligase D [Lichenicoccus sp.]|uniref:DNA ligase D n=1 Tax=Lichenicoccus sp. TaxID=2781899 RepID=UPI003D0CB0AA